MHSYVKDDNNTNRDTLKANDDDCYESGKLELLRQLLEEVTSPEQTLCQCFGIENSDCTLLDEKMTSLIESAPVNNEGPDDKYDSGVSELSLERTRISIRLMSEKDAPALPPKPHTFSRPHDGYANVAGETESGKSKHHITKKSPKSSAVSVEVGSAIDGVSDYVRYHRKELSSHLGMTTPPPQKKKSKCLSKLLGRMRGGSGKAEAPSSSPKLINSKGMRRYKRGDSKRSSDTSSSTGSTHSDISKIDDDDIVPVLHHSDINTEGNDGNLLGIVANSKVWKHILHVTRRHIMDIDRSIIDKLTAAILSVTLLSAITLLLTGASLRFQKPKT